MTLLVSICLAVLTVYPSMTDSQFENSMRPIILEDLCVLLHPDGQLASGGDSIFSSLFIALKYPETGEKDNPCSGICISDIPNPTKDTSECHINNKIANKELSRIQGVTTRENCYKLCVLIEDCIGFAFQNTMQVSPRDQV